MPKTGYLLVIFMWSLLQCGQGYGKEALSDRVSLLEEKVEELENESLTLDRLMKLLSQDSNSGNDVNAQDREIIWDQPPVTILEARRQVTETETIFSVQYKRNVDGVKTLWTGWTVDFSFLSNDDPLGDGIWETSSTIAAPDAKLKRDEENWDWDFDNMNLTSILFNVTSVESLDYHYQLPVTVSFLANNGLSLVVQLDHGDSDAVETDVSLPLLKTEPSGDFVYQDGEDVTFKIMTTPEEDAAKTVSVETTFLYSDGDEVKFTEGRSMSGLMEFTGNKSHPGYHEWDVKIRTSEDRTSGILDVSAVLDIDKSEAILVKRMWFGKLVILRPSTQEGPFPTGFIDIHKPRWFRYEETDDGDTALVMGCPRTESEGCRFTCLAVGDDIIDIEVYNVDPDGTKTSVSDLPRFSVVDVTMKQDYYRLKIVTFSKDTMNEDRDRFSCVAMNSRGRTATLQIITDTGPTFGLFERDTEASQILKSDPHGNGDAQDE